jgi:putative membrane protein
LKFFTRKNYKKKIWLLACLLSICLSIAVFTELFEWGVVMFTGTPENLYLGWQGDIWDAQWNMLLCLIGALFSIIFLRNFSKR